MLLQVNVYRVRTASITLEDPSRENPSCGDQVSTAQTTVLSANVNQPRNTKQRFALYPASQRIVCSGATGGRSNNVKKTLIVGFRLDNGI
ncbi:hypothetical protein [Mesorhizobium sp. A623]